MRSVVQSVWSQTVVKDIRVTDKSVQLDGPLAGRMLRPPLPQFCWPFAAFAQAACTASCTASCIASCTASYTASCTACCASSCTSNCTARLAPFLSNLLPAQQVRDDQEKRQRAKSNRRRVVLPKYRRCLYSCQRSVLLVKDATTRKQNARPHCQF